MTSKSKAPLILALPFTLIAAVILLFSIIPALYDWGRMQSWVAVEATLVSTDIDARHGGVRWSTSYKINAQYRYNYNQQVYEGTRIGIHDRSYDSVGTWHSGTLEAIARMKPLRVWVNPENPNEAIFDRTLRWNLLGFSLLLVMGFGGLGILGILAAYGKDEEVLDSSSHTLIKPDWRKSHIQSDKQLWGLWYGFTVVSLTFVWMTAQVFIKWDSSNPYALFVLLFPLASILFFVRLVRETVAWRHLGFMPLYLYSPSAVVGPEINGSIALRCCLPEDALAGASLRCIAKQEYPFGKRTRSEQNVVWSEQRLLQSDNKLGGHNLKFSFLLPETLPGAPGQDLVWKLLVNIRCDAPGIDHTRVYTIPACKMSKAQRAHQTTA